MTDKFALGTMNFGSQLNEKESLYILDAAYDRGIREYDTAFGYPAPMLKETYGITNTILGKWKKKRDVIFHTKILGNDTDEDICYENVKKQLGQLGLEKVESCLIHWPSSNHHEQNAQVLAFNQLQHDGFINRWGLSNASYEVFNEYRTAATSLGADAPCWTQNRFSPMDDPTGIVQAPVPLQVYGALHYGCLAGRYRDGVPKDSRVAWLRKKEWEGKDIDIDKWAPQHEFVDDWLMSCELHGVHPATQAYKWLLEYGFVKQIVIGVSQAEQLEAVPWDTKTRTTT